MPKTWLSLSLLFVSGCAFAPPGAYPIFKPDPAVFALFKSDVDFDSVLDSDRKTQRGLLAGLHEQHMAYQQQAYLARRGIYEQSDWSTGGAAIGIAGGLIENVATAVTGAVIASGVTIVGSRYRQAEQVGIYRLAAQKTMCLAEIASDAMVSQYYDFESSEEVRTAYRRPITRGANIAVRDILAGLHTQLDTLTPTPPDMQAIVVQLSQFRMLNKVSDRAIQRQNKVFAYGLPATLDVDSPDKWNVFIEAATARAAVIVANLMFCAKTGRSVPPENTYIAE